MAPATVQRLRREALKELLDRHYKGVIADMAVDAERDEAYLWQLLHGKRSIGEKSARHLESKLPFKTEHALLMPGGDEPRVAPFGGNSVPLDRAQVRQTLTRIRKELDLLESLTVRPAKGVPAEATIQERMAPPKRHRA